MIGSSGGCEGGGISGTQSLLRRCGYDTQNESECSYCPEQRSPPDRQMLNQGVTQMYLIVKTSRSRILIGSEIIKIKNVYIVISCTRLMRLYIFRANSVRMQIQCTRHAPPMKKSTVGKTPKITRAQIAA